MDPRRQFQQRLRAAKWFGLDGFYIDRSKLITYEEVPQAAAPAESGPVVIPDPFAESSAVVESSIQPMAVEMDEASRKEAFESLVGMIEGCTKCKLCETRNKVVPGSGGIEARCMLVGEAPGANEDMKGVPFVGAAGQLLTRMMKAIELERDQVYITNVLKCRPPRNRDPEEEEVASCQPYLWKQVELIRPEVILTLGAYASRAILERPGASLWSMRGQVWTVRGMKVICTYHPSALLRYPDNKKKAWDDLKLLRTLL